MYQFFNYLSHEEKWGKMNFKKLQQLVNPDPDINEQDEILKQRYERMSQ